MPGDLPFHTTRWSLVLASRAEAPEGRKALDELCEAYWYPLYVYLRRKGLGDAEARDRVQEFVVGLLERDATGPPGAGALAGADPERGSFRAYLMGAIRHHTANARREANALKRGGGRVTSFDLSDPKHAAAERYGSPAAVRSPEEEFERAWALALIGRASERLEAEYRSRGRGPVFEALRDTLDGSEGERTHSQRAAELGCTVGAVKVNAHRLRQRMGELLREEVAQTIAPRGGPSGPESGAGSSAGSGAGISAEVDAELRHLFATLGGRAADSP